MEITEHDLLCDKVLQFIYDKKCTKTSIIEQTFKPDFILNCLEELSVSDFITFLHSSRDEYCIQPEGENIIKNYLLYSTFKKETFADFKPIEFKKELENFLNENQYSTIDILPLVRKYTNFKGIEEIAGIRLKIREFLQQFKSADLIQYSNDVNGMCTRQSNKHSYQPISIKSTLKFECYIEEKNNKAAPSVTYITHGNYSPIAGHDVKIKDIQNLDLPDFGNNPIATPSKVDTTQANNNSKKLNWIARIWKYASDNKIIAGLIVAAIVAAVTYLIKYNHWF